MSCRDCGRDSLEIQESYTGSWFICCKECKWVEIYDLYKADNQPENYGDD